ncbi:MAG: PqqD family protein [Candidatus Scalindua sp.]|nr:PqqD family protein [Candidatus Scalindua sp.]
MNSDKRSTRSRNEKENPSEYPLINETAEETEKNADTLQQMYARWNVDTLKDDIQSVDLDIDGLKHSIDITSAHPCRLNGIEEHSILDETVLYSPENEAAFSLNSSAKAIWELCEGKYTVLEISQKLGARFGISPQELLDDVKTTVTQLHKLVLLELKNGFRTKSNC